MPHVGLGANNAGFRSVFEFRVVVSEGGWADGLEGGFGASVGVSVLASSVVEGCRGGPSFGESGMSPTMTPLAFAAAAARAVRLSFSSSSAVFFLGGSGSAVESSGAVHLLQHPVELADVVGIPRTPQAVQPTKSFIWKLYEDINQE